jgi:cytochrome c oxidase subunit 3
MPEAEAFAPQFASVRHRDETAELGMWIFIATEVLLFGGLILGYFVYRHAYPAAFAAASRQTHIVIGTANTAILLTSSFLVACAVEAFSAETRKICVALLLGAVLLGLAFIALKGIEY